jgi:phage tail protein X
MSQAITVKGEGITLDLLLYRVHGVAGQGLLEQTLDLNPGLGATGPVLPLGAAVIVPDLPATGAGSTKVVTLFG